MLWYVYILYCSTSCCLFCDCAPNRKTYSDVILFSSYIYRFFFLKYCAIFRPSFFNTSSHFCSFSCRTCAHTQQQCIPGYDDRPEDNDPWTSHNKNGYTFDDWSNAVQNAAKALRAESTAKAPPTFTGIFHDWGTVAGGMWMNRALLDDEEESSSSTETTTTGGERWKRPTGVVYFDVLLGPHPKSTNLPPKNSIIPRKSVKAMISGTLYQLLLAKSFFLQRYVSKYLSCFTFLSGFLTLELLRLGPLYPFDSASIQPLYKQVHKELSLSRVVYMAYPYWNIYKAKFCSIFSSFFGRRRKNNNTTTTSGVFKDLTLHLDWKKTPILYMYGTKKRTQFHDETSLKMLEQETTTENNKSLSKVVPVEEAGHFLYVQKPKVCLDTVVRFMNDTAAAAAGAAGATTSK